MAPFSPHQPPTPAKMAFALHFVFPLCVMSGLLTGIQSHPVLDENQCPDGWTQVNQRCFIFKKEERGFSDAESVCRGFGGNLVSIHSAMENAVIKELVKEDSYIVNTWIGLHDAVKEGGLMWTDGTPFEYDDFGCGQPTGARNADCIEIQQIVGGWGDGSCAGEKKFVCAKDVN